MPSKRQRAVVETTSGRDSDVVITGSQVSPSRRRPASQRVRGGGSAAAPQSTREPLAPELVQTLLPEDAKRGWTSGSSDGVERQVKRRKGKERAREVVELSDGTSKDEEEVIHNRGGFEESAAGDGDCNGREAEEEDEEDEDESDVDWEDVDLSSRPMNLKDIMKAHVEAPPAVPEQPATLELTLGDPMTRKAADPRRKITAVERRIRLETHKLHLICLLYHSYLRNRWCNDPEVRANLRPLIPQKVYDKLNHDPTDQQYRRATLFLDGLREAVAVFKKKFKITHRGMEAPMWQDLEALKKWSPQPGTEMIAKKAFIKASKTLSGSRDLGAQLFCAMLRSAGITARIVWSLQVLPFHFATKQKPFAQPMALTPITNTSEAGSSSTPAPRRTGGLRRPVARTPAVVSKPKPPPPKAELPPESEMATVWVEAWSAASQRWITVDPIVTASVARPQKLEPALSDPLNTLSYAIAFEDTGHAVDVTRRYATWFSAKTRRWRVTSTKGGERWYTGLLQKFSRGFPIDRDQLENAEFAQLHLQEPIPNAVQDIKDHPIFALKRHLRKNEVVHPERKVGSVRTSKGGLETIYRREDVKEVRTKQQWYKVGRMVKSDEMIPLKFTSARKARKHENGGEEEPPPYQPMYALEQTDLYNPPPVVNGIVPKNKFGNLDVFVPTMVPQGGVHIPHPLARNAARIVGVDYSDVVTGFEFRNRMTSPVLKGVVVAEMYKDAVEAVAEGLEDEKEREEQRERAKEVLRLWRRWILRLRIRQRLGFGTDEAVEMRLPGEIEGRARKGGGSKSKAKGAAATTIKRRRKVVESEDEEEEEEEEEEEVEGGGGFLAESDEDGCFSTGGDQDVSEDEYGWRAGSHPDASGGFVPEDSGSGGGGFIAQAEDVGDGFIPDDIGGGFVCEQDALEVHLRSEEDNHSGVPESAAEYLGGEFVCEQDAPEVHIRTEEETSDVEDGGGGGFLPDADAVKAGSREPIPITGSKEDLPVEGIEVGGGFVAEAGDLLAREKSSSQEGLYEEPDDEDEGDPDWDLFGL
ncbi:hypothetical protein FN846DRAFT_941700 [Sphaerosporella brunnea]|uniref:Rad4 transglutaminase-like domain-containing protein n=1 Tax=Sphaerosporella brunnea TaxID=1250544 RepID=A0A5J5F1G1_9PEZI|nr:hypothetical protein FN846DRAFT_941700 [Sphaerosporella brunnea]